MPTIHLPPSFVVRNESSEITVKPVEAAWDNGQIMLNCELYWKNAKVAAFRESVRLPVEMDPIIQMNPLAEARFVQITLNNYFADLYPQVIAKYLER
jgi:hypothetical protein